MSFGSELAIHAKNCGGARVLILTLPYRPSSGFFGTLREHQMDLECFSFLKQSLSAVTWSWLVILTFTGMHFLTRFLCLFTGKEERRITWHWQVRWVKVIKPVSILSKPIPIYKIRSSWSRRAGGVHGVHGWWMVTWVHRCVVTWSFIHRWVLGGMALSILMGPLHKNRIRSPG